MVPIFCDCLKASEWCLPDGQIGPKPGKGTLHPSRVSELSHFVSYLGGREKEYFTQQGVGFIGEGNAGLEGKHLHPLSTLMFSIRNGSGKTLPNLIV
jgi:hypothetical protein